MKHSRLLVPGILLLLYALALSGCSAETLGKTGGDITVRVVVTRDFGGEIMSDETLKVPPGTSAMAALKQVTEVETAYGGGFVSAINGVRSGDDKGDWFISVNGIMANGGALAYTLRDGDIQRWDFHDWSFRMFIPAIMGDFPEPLAHGYGGQVRPTLIVHEAGMMGVAQDLEGSLKRLGVADVSIKSTLDLRESDKQHSNLVLIGTMNYSLIAELNRAWNRLGFFVHFKDGAMVVYNSKGEIAAEYGAGSGVVQATQNPWNPSGIGVSENVVWMVSGTDEAGVKSAANALIDRYDEFRHAYAVVVTNGEIIKVPQ